MPIVDYRGQKITFPDDMSAEEIQNEMGSIADQIDADLLNSEASTAKPGLGDKLKEFAKEVAIKPVRDYLGAAQLTDNRSVTDNMDGATAKDTGFDQKAGSRVLKETAARKPETLKAGAEIVDGLSGIAKVGLNKGYAGIGRIEAGATRLAGDLLDSDTLRDAADAQQDYADEVEGRAVLRGTKSTAFEPSALAQEAPEIATNAIGSVVTSGPAIALGVASGGSAIPGIFGTSALSEYGAAGDDLNTAGKTVRAIGMGAAEALGEKLGGTDKFVDALTQTLGGKNKLIELGTKMLTTGAKEIPSEEITTTAQFLLDKNELFGLNQNATLDDYIEAVKETAKVAAFQGGGMAGAGGLIRAATGAPVIDPVQAETAQKNAESEAAIHNITLPETTVEEAIALATKAVDSPLTPKVTSVLDQAEPAKDAIFAADILGDEDADNTNDGLAGVVDGAIAGASDNVQGGVGNILSDSVGGIPDATATPLESIGTDVSAGTGNGQPDGALAPENINQAVGQLGKGAVDNLYGGLFKALQEGKDTFAGIKDRVLVEAKPYFDAGLIKSPEELKRYVNKGYPKLEAAQPNGALSIEQVIESEDGLPFAKDVAVAGESIDDDWTAFNPDTGTLGIPRAEMPQIKAEHRGAMTNFLNARGIDHVQDTVPAASLKPTQQEFSNEKVKKAIEYKDGNRSILVSSDGHVLDGHHQWLAKLNAGEDIDVIRLNAPIKDLLSTVAEFPSASLDEGASAPAANGPVQVASIGGKNSGESISVNREGDNLAVMYNGEPLVSFETEQPVTLPASATIEEIRKAVKESGQFKMQSVQFDKSYAPAAGAAGTVAEPVQSRKAQINAKFEANRDTLRAWMPDMEWAVIGGRMIRDEEGNVGRTKWEPKDYDLDGIRRASNMTFPGMQAAVQKALDGKPLSAKENRAIDALIEFAETIRNSNADEMADESEAAGLTFEEENAFIQLEQDMDWMALAQSIAADDETLASISTKAQNQADEFNNEVGEYLEQITEYQRQNQGNVSQAQPGQSQEGNGSNGAARENQGNQNDEGSGQFTERRAAGNERLERRQDPETRKKVTDMSADEMRRALLIDDLTGIGNRRAYDESAKKPYQVSIDADGLKWVNDNLGHESGDLLLEAIGQAISRYTSDGYHISGDEYVVQADTEAAAAAIMDGINKLLAGAVVEGVNSNGDQVTLNGIGISYGIAKDLKDAETRLQQHKQSRETAGFRSARGEQPANAVITSQRGQDNQSNTTSQTDLLGDNTASRQALADAERAKDAKRNSGADNQDSFTLTGSNSEADQAAAAGAQSLFDQPLKQPVKLISENGSNITSPLYVGLAENGYTMLRMDDPKTYKDKGGTEHRTFEKDGVRIALDGQQVLFNNKGRVINGIGNDDDVTLAFIGVDEAKRGKGLAKNALQLIGEIADDKQLNVYLEPTQLDKSGLNKDQLIKLYSDAGFEQKGESNNVMVRTPNAGDKKATDPARAKVGDIIETGGIKYRKTENGFELLKDEAPAEKLAQGTRINGEVEKSAADRLEKLLAEIEETNDVRFSQRREPLTGAKNNIANVVAELRKAKTTTGVNGLLEQASRALLKNYGPMSDVVDQVIESLEGKAAPAPKAQFADNKVFTADKVEAARARLKSKLGNLNSGIDPELLVDGMTIAGAYIESGVRDFSQYAKAMVNDFGDKVTPYLLSFYEAARAFPGVDKDGMTDAAKAEELHNALLVKMSPAAVEEIKPVVGNGVVETPKSRAKPNGQATLTQDWGVDNIDGWTDNADGTAQGSDFGLIGGVKDQFLAEAKKFLTQTAKLLEAEGFTPHTDSRGRIEKSVSVNEAGPAVSGEVSLTMRKGDAGVYVNIGTSSIRGLTGNHPQGVAIMTRTTNNADKDKYATRGANTWLRADISATELANKLLQSAEYYVKNETSQPEKANDNANTTESKQIPGTSAEGDLFSEQPGRSDSKPMDAWLAQSSGEPAGNQRVSTGVSSASGNGTGRAGSSNGNESSSGSRKTSDAGNITGAANDNDRVSDFEITEEIGKGTAASKFRANVNAIKLIKTLEAEKRTATPEERKLLAQYTGFGAFAGAFDRNNKQFTKEYAELKELLTPEEYDSARASILNAYYTKKEIVNGMYDALAHLGFKGGRVLEPSLGSGNFFGFMPAALRNKSKLNGVELDVLTSRLAKQLYPNANIATATGFEKYQAPAGYFDLVIGNPPFGSEKITDTDRTPYSGFSIHNYFLAKSIDKLRDGGIMAVVVSHSFMDAKNTQAREWISQRANLISAIRLPSDAFKENAGTEVITDVLFFQKTATPEANPDWLEAAEQDGYTFNNYFLGNPRQVLGRVEDTTSQFGKTFTVKSTGDMATQLKGLIAEMPRNIYVEPTQRVEVLDSADNTIPDGVKVGSYFTDDKGNIRQRLEDNLGVQRSTAWEAPNAKAKERMLSMMAMRDLLRNQMRLERDPMADNAAIERNRERLNLRYDAFLKEFGHLNNMTNRRLFLDDTESALLQALELDFDAGVSKSKALATGMEEKAPSAEKADIFKRRVLFPPSDSIVVQSAKDALLASLNAKGAVDIEYMAEVYDKPQAEIISELGDVIYNDPMKGYVPADEYLSGDVKTKLAEAQSKAQTDESFRRNVAALEKVIPKDKLPSEIYASAGANWIPADVYAEFASEITGIPADGVEYKYLSAAAIWISDKSKGGDVAKMTSEFGTDKINAFDLFHLLINGKAAEVRKAHPTERGKTVTDVPATEAARAKYEKIKQEWASWIFKDAERADRLATIYNNKHNRVVPRKFDGSHMQFYGMSPAVTLRPHQKDVVWRAVQDRNVLLDHVVGAGKTMAMAATAMEMKRLGIARKPFFVVPNHLTLQWRSEFTKLYPASNILAATPEDFAKDRREKLFSKMVTGNYDAIIIGHSSLSKVGLPKAVEEKMYADQVAEIADAIELAKRERGDRGITRAMEQIKKNLEAKIEKLKAKTALKDNVVSFDELAIDALFVDEMHEFKNLYFTTQMQRVAGLGNPTGSGKALDMFMKIRWMNDTFGEDVPLITATGTPVSNSLAEMFTMQRYMKFNQLKRDDLHMFDAWAKQFGEVENVYEVAPSGVGYRQSTRFSKFKNLPSLMASYTSFADIITMQDLKDQSAQQGKVFPVPKLKTGKPINEIAQRSDLQRDFFGIPKLATDDEGNIQFELDPGTALIEENAEGKFILKMPFGFDTFDTREEAELELVSKSLTPKTFIDPDSLLGKFADLARLTKESNGKINALSLTGLANKCGLDYRILDPNAPDFAGSKINKAVSNMVDLWQSTAKDRGTQIVFCDLSIPKSARSDMANKEKRVYVRDNDGELTHKAKGVIYAPTGMEGYPFYLVNEGKSGHSIYEAVSGMRMPAYGISDKASAKTWIDNYVGSDTNRDRIFTLRDQYAIEQTAIDEYRDAKELEVAEDGSNEVSMADLEAVAGSSQFSVYDDIKEKLMRAGVPEIQIAFIHDYNTPKQKEELFKRVNRGDVRFLFGSTPKLGAGTNVQKRLVGLHHIDAPWRPSDLEQREGRIIRQGNELYARDPENFEIAIYRYATEQTYDTRRWQLLEHKAAGIEQLRKYTGEAEIEDVASEASNSADMKAAASGNPLILEETKLRTEVKRLQSLERAHTDSQYAMARKIKGNEGMITDYLPRRIEELEAMAANAKANPNPDDKTKIAMINIAGKRLTSKEAAENELGLAATKVRQDFDINANVSIQYRGVEFKLRRGFALGGVVLESPEGNMHTYTPKEGVSPSGMLTRFNNYIDSFDAKIEDAKARIVKYREENEQLKPLLNKPFEEASTLKNTQAEHADVQRRLMKSSQLEAIPEDQREEFNRLIAERKDELKARGYETALKESERERPAFSRRGAINPMPLRDIEKTVAEISGKWNNGPSIIIVDDMEDMRIPVRLREENDRQLSQGAKGQPEGFYMGGKVYVVADQMGSVEDVMRVVFHETLGHYGLRKTYGAELNKILDEVYMARRSEVMAKAKEYGLDFTNQGDRRAAAEEVLAEMAQDNPQSSIVQRALALIRKFLRSIGFDIELSDNDIVVNYLLPARAYVEGLGNNGRTVDMLPAFMRSKPQTQTEAFKRWFGDSKVVDADGKPLVVYHGTPSDFNEFKTDSQLGAHFGVTVGQAEAIIADMDMGNWTFMDGSNIRPVYLKIENPLDMPSDLGDWDSLSSLKEYLGPDNYEIFTNEEMNGWTKASDVRSALIAKGYDGIKYNNLFEGEGIDEEQDAYIVFSPNQIKSATGNDGGFDPDNNDIRFSRNPQSTLQPQWQNLPDSKMDSAIRVLQDKNIDLKRVVQAIKEVGNNIDERWNAYLQEELYHGRTAKRTQDFIKQELEPLIEDMRMRGVGMADFEQYLHMRHAEERNIQIATINPDMQDGGSGIDTADAQSYLANLPAADKIKYEALAKRIDRIVRMARQVLIDYGLESADTIAAWEAVYDFYVPLMREDMERGFGNGTGQGFSVKGNAAKRATGSSRAVVDIIANIAQQYEKNIIRGEKNRVATALIGLAKLNPNDDFWKVDTPPTIKTINKATNQVETITDPLYKNRDNVVVARIPNKLGKIVERSVVFNEFDERAMKLAASIKNLDQDQLGLFLGITSQFTRWIASVNTQYNPVFGFLNIVRDAGGVMLNLSTTPIAGKQAEVLKNAFPAIKAIYEDLRAQRKGQSVNNGLVALFEEFQYEGGQTGYRDMFASAKDRSEALRKVIDPTWWQTSKLGKIISVNGAIASQEQWLADKAITPVFDWLSDFNTTLENALRLSTYKVALENGQSKQGAASLAKNISVNFNRKGQVGRQMGALFAFFNASVQGSARIAETLGGPAGKRIIQGGLLLGVMQALALTAAGYDDEEPPEFVKNRNLVIPLDWLDGVLDMDDKYVTIPLPLGFNALPAVGRIATEFALSGGEDPQERLLQIMSMIMDVTNPVGGSGSIANMITPSVGDPFVDLYANKDWTGRDISREDFSSLNPTPGFTRSRDATWDISVGLAKAINYASGGTDNKVGFFSPTADEIEYLVGQFTGGVGRETIKAGTTIESLFTGEDLPTYKIPLVGRFYGDAAGQSSQGNKFYSNIREMNQHKAEIADLRRTGGNVKAYREKYPEAALAEQAGVVEREVSKLRKRKAALQESGADRGKLEAIDNRITTVMQKFNERIAARKD
jgi:N12 class adenine-specific DNA methylase/GGDEF domain-containing protein/adenine-specific DNA methylase